MIDFAANVDRDAPISGWNTNDDGWFRCLPDGRALIVLPELGGWHPIIRTSERNAPEWSPSGGVFLDSDQAIVAVEIAAGVRKMVDR